uniref:Rho GTPase-activating protein 19 n=1 Tax=Apteryx owenii TaxID=8824 RepID=A0A8B9P6M3_APTOW
YTSDAICNFVICNDSSLRSQPIIFNPDFFVEKLRHEKPEVFTELVVSNITRLIDLPGAELAQLMGEEDPKLPGGNSIASGFLRSLMSLKRKGDDADYLRAEGLFRVPGNSIRQQILKDALNSGTDIDLDSGEFHSNDVATLLKMFLGELPEPLLTHKHFHAHLKIADLTLFDEKGNKTSTPDKERQIEALQLLFLILPAPNRSLLKLLLDLLYQTAKKQDKNKMSAHNLALMFAPHILWPRNVTANDLQENITKLNNGVTFMIKHSQKLFKQLLSPLSQDDLDLLTSPSSKELQPLKSQKRSRLDPCHQEETQQRTEEALKELFRHVHNMPDSAKKKKLIRQFNKHPTALTPGSDVRTPPAQRRTRSRSFSGLIKRKVLGTPVIMERKSRDVTPEPERASKENIHLLQKCGSPAHVSQAKLKFLEGRKEVRCSHTQSFLRGTWPVGLSALSSTERDLQRQCHCKQGSVSGSVAVAVCSMPSCERWVLWKPGLEGVHPTGLYSPSVSWQAGCHGKEGS